MASFSYPYRSHISTITFCSLRTLFLVSILHSSQKTRESLLLGSECVSKHFRQIEWPHVRVSGSFKNSRQLRHDRVEFNSSAFFLFLAIICWIFLNAWLSFVNYSTFSSSSASFLPIFSVIYLIFSLNCASSSWSILNWRSMSWSCLRFSKSCVSSSLFSARSWATRAFESVLLASRSLSWRSRSSLSVLISSLSFWTCDNYYEKVFWWNSCWMEVWIRDIDN